MNALFRRPEPRIEHLDARQTLRLKGSRGVRLRCLEGVCWVTREGDARDHVLRAGEAYSVDGPGRVVVWAITGARLRVEEATSARGALFRPLAAPIRASRLPNLRRPAA